MSVFVDGSGCKCDGPCWECGGTGCKACDGQGTRLCEMPCWQRVGRTSQPCCPDCAPLEEPLPLAAQLPTGGKRDDA